MANLGFKGTNIVLPKIAMAGTREAAVLQVDVQFCDSEGRCHGVISHNLPLVESDDPPLYAAAKAFYDELKRRIEQLHYTDPAGASSAPEKVAYGIGEALRGGPDTPDGVGVQG